MQSGERELKIGSLRNAVASLRRSLAVYDRLVAAGADPDEIETVQAGVVQNFEFTYELCWVFMRRWLKENTNPEAIQGITRKHLFRLSRENYLIDDFDAWMVFHEARNQTSHMYNRKVALDVFEKAVAFLPYAERFLSRLEGQL